MLDFDSLPVRLLVVYLHSRLDRELSPLQPNPWQPPGFGMRGCIVRSPTVTSDWYRPTDHLSRQGRPFAWQEAQLALVTIFQRFDLVMHDPTYELELKQTLTIKPHNFFVHALPRKDRSRLLAIPSSALLAHEAPAERAPKATVSAAAANLQPLYVLYGVGVEIAMIPSARMRFWSA